MQHSCEHRLFVASTVEAQQQHVQQHATQHHGSHALLAACDAILSCNNHCFKNIGAAPSPRTEFRLTYISIVCHSASNIAGIHTAYLPVLGSHDLPSRKTAANPAMTDSYRLGAMRLCHALQYLGFSRVNSLDW